MPREMEFTRLIRGARARARVITAEHVDGALRVGLASLPRTRFLGRLEFLAAREERIPSSFLREGT